MVGSSACKVCRCLLACSPSWWFSADRRTAHYLNWLSGVQHKDLSLNNLMYRLEDGVVCGVLND